MMDLKLKFRTFIGLAFLISIGTTSNAQTVVDFGAVNELNPKIESINVNSVLHYSKKGDSNFKVTVIPLKPYSFFETLDTIVKYPSDSIIEVKLGIIHNMPQKGICILSNERGLAGYFRLSGSGQYSNWYYDNTRNKEGEDLKTALKSTLAVNYNSMGYSSARIEMFSKIDNWKVNGRGSSVDKIECVYTGRSITNYPFNTGTLVNSPWNFNTEHTYPQGLFSSNEPMKSDLHHLFPTDVSENGKRGNDAFGTGSGKYEPRDEQKGRSARAMLYFVTRYQDYQGFLAGQETLLRNWAKSFPPDSVEVRRNQDIYGAQLNRNPYIDYPQFLERISSISTTASVQKIKDFVVSPSLKTRVSTDTLIYFQDREEMIYNNGTENISVEVYQWSEYMRKKIASDTALEPDGILIFRFSFPGLMDAGIINSKDTIVIVSNVLGKEELRFVFEGFYNTGSSIQELNQSVSFKIFPNPAQTSITIGGQSMERVRASKYSILDVSGKFIAKGKIENQSIDVAQIPAGYYLLNITNEKGEIGTEKLIIER